MQFASQFIVMPGTFMARLTGVFTFKVKSYFCNTSHVLCVVVHTYMHTLMLHTMVLASSWQCVGAKHLNHQMFPCKLGNHITVEN